MSPACTMAGYPKTFCTASLPLGLDSQEGLRSAIDVLKRDLKAGGIAPAGFEAPAVDHTSWRHTAKSAIKTAEQKREEQWEEKRARRCQRAETGAAPQTTTSSHAATATGSAVRGSASTATARAAALPRTDIYGRKLHCLPRQTDANIFP